MMWTINSHEIENVLSLSGEDRYNYFIKRVADWGKIWSLRNDDGWVSGKDEEGNEFFPVWPHPQFALLCATENWSDCKAEAIDLSVWLQRWIPGLNSDRRKIAVFPKPSNKGIIVSTNQLKGDLDAEMSLYE